MNNFQSYPCKANILIVDDTPNNLHLLSSMLEEQGYEVRCANSGAIALKAVEIEHPDIILLDINMPNMNGYEVCERLKLDKQTQAIPVIFLSALSETIDKVRAFKTGGIDYITKPFQLEEVLARIETQLSLRQMQQELQKAKDQALKALKKEQELNRLKSEFVSMISHDFRNPLTSIQGFAGLLECGDDIPTPEMLNRYINKINNAVDQLLSLLDEILLIGKIEVGKMQYEPVLVDLENFCKELIDSLQYSLGNQHLICFNCASNSTKAEMDLILLQRILTNLLSNAIKYSPSRSEIYLDLECQNHITIFKVRDQGIGIPLENQSHLFEAFYRCSNVGNIKGTGLGLAIVKKCVEVHQGNISLESRENLGTTFIVSLPRYAQSEF
ncbi:hybrid sensor histidine kinase/response regulator [Anabaena cylindrica FACHB-243]|uniref:histidine kinase n=1 Tax=Anabaena cylindrica (strain ATCC 27899 / PCC 7122) TaxID=272123 RepID=K9ZPI5_ANACC|nr:MULTISPECIES: hybrid sensor histidine kinase/response regulator [Anabaena]AFZ60467.1 response regulator receiver sensor signal transduction histidine kinase [Anabaena cylindrica PCC 7122]MBD2416452.1 hybrid sensor histidine kinase/response regulator [Anabaena cylindrica FACHB-243]MBY5284836.1 hybrid sensor histidine kinase/response regulator [Anabaena sp. CCAP 1446/1C]MBY5310380.1 hybrid sensor histidine kinase/response regulator [Anabaena sp. CCAP 1446/1C]MCM2408507.1 hybrid sensor histidi